MDDYSSLSKSALIALLKEKVKPREPMKISQKRVLGGPTVEHRLPLRQTAIIPDTEEKIKVVKESVKKVLQEKAHKPLMEKAKKEAEVEYGILSAVPHIAVKKRPGRPKKEPHMSATTSTEIISTSPDVAEIVTMEKTKKSPKKEEGKHLNPMEKMTIGALRQFVKESCPDMFAKRGSGTSNDERGNFGKSKRLSKSFKIFLT